MSLRNKTKERIAEGAAAFLIVGGALGSLALLDKASEHKDAWKQLESVDLRAADEEFDRAMELESDILLIGLAGTIPLVVALDGALSYHRAARNEQFIHRPTTAVSTEM